MLFDRIGKGNRSGRSRRSFFKQVAQLTAAWPMAKGLAAAGGPPRPWPDSSAVDIGLPAWVREGIVLAWGTSPNISDIRIRNTIRMKPGDVVPGWKSHAAAVAHFKEMGINVVVMPFEAGWGLKADADAIAGTRDFTEVAHRNGLKVVGYVGGTMMCETLYLDVPEARNWEMIDERGRPMYYGDQTFRHFPCRNNPDYQGYLQKVLRFGIEDVKLDGFSYDQLHWWPEPWSCHCKHCQEGFRAYLNEKYTVEELKSRLGFTNLEGIRVPDFNLNAPPVTFPPPLKDPLMQEWAQFRCASLAHWWEETNTFVHKLNPQVALTGNPTPYAQYNFGFIYGMDLQRLLPPCDAIWSEEGNEPAWTADERLVSRIRAYKMVRSMGRSVLVWQRVAGAAQLYEPPYPEDPLVLCVAESLAYNDTNLGAWDTQAVEPPPRVHRYHNFFYSHLKDLVETTTITDVAMLRSFASIEFNPAKSLSSTILFEQTLIQAKFPFGIIFDTHLKDLSKFKVLVLANQDALSDEQAGQIRRFVENGGGLVATEETSLLTEWRRKRDKFALADLLGIDMPPALEDRNPLRKEFGKGRVVYLPQIEPAVDPPPPIMSYNFPNQCWKLPKNYDELMEAVRWAGRNSFSVNVDAPLWVTMELAEQKRSNTWLLHLVNFRMAEAIMDIPLHVTIPRNMRLQAAVLESPDDVPRQALEVKGQEGVVSINVPKLEVYDIILLRMLRK